MAKIAVLGLGAMGSRMAARLLAAGHELCVWNRDSARAEVLAEAGAEVAPTPAAAVRRAAVVIAMLRDDEASRRVWLDPSTGALAAMPIAAVAIESSTLGIAWVRELAGHCRAQDKAFIDAPVAGSRDRAETGQLIYFVGGETAVVERVEPILLAMGSAVHHAGPAGSGAAVKLMVNALFGVQVAALAELLGCLRQLGVDPATALALLASTPVCSPAALRSGEAMLAGRFAPMFPIDLVRKDFGYVIEAMGARAPLAAAAHGVFSEAVAQGLGAMNITAVSRLY